MPNAVLLDELNKIIIALNKPISDEEITEGWNEKNKKTAGDMFLAIRLAIEYGGPMPPLSILKGLNHWGVICGPIYDQAMVLIDRLKLQHDTNLK